MTIDERVATAAESAGWDPELFDWHLEAVHGWEPHDEGYVERGIAGVVECLRSGGCETGAEAG